MYHPGNTDAMRFLSHLTIEELKEILNDDSKFEELLKDSKQLKDSETEKEMVIASNQSLAEYNLSKEPALTEGKEKVRDLAEKGQALYQSVKEKIEELKSAGGNMSMDTAYSLLQASAAEIEEESETVAENFLTREIDIDQFLEKFATLRTLMHMRKVKVDKMKELMSRKTPNYMNSFYPQSGNVSVPYPMGPLNMPMPGAYRPNHF